MTAYVRNNPCISSLPQERDSHFAPVDSEKDYVQILHDGAGSFWVLVLRKGSDHPLIFDFNKVKHTVLPSFIQTQLALIMKCENDEIHFLRPNIIQIFNNSQAASLAIAAATNYLHYGASESNFNFEIDDVTTHILSGLRNKLMEPVPTSTGPFKRRRGEAVQETLKVYCYCRLPEHFDNMVYCDSCSKTYHIKCITMPNMWTEEDNWVCERCANDFLYEILNEDL